LIAVNGVMHVFCVGVIIQMAERTLAALKGRRGFFTMLAFVMSAIVTMVAMLLGLEASVWATACWLLGALPDYGSAMLDPLQEIFIRSLATTSETFLITLSPNNA
jgi:hypothetical protein